jgi:hypothetical protein
MIKSMYIYRNVMDGLLYSLYYVSPPKMTGGYLEAVAYMHSGNTVKYADKTDFVKISDAARNRVPPVAAIDPTRNDT